MNGNAVTAAYSQLMYLIGRGILPEPDNAYPESQLATTNYVTAKIQESVSSGLPPTIDGGNF